MTLDFTDFVMQGENGLVQSGEEAAAEGDGSPISKGPQSPRADGPMYASSAASASKLLEKAKWIPMRLRTEERVLLKLLEGGLEVAWPADALCIMRIVASPVKIRDTDHARAMLPPPIPKSAQRL